MTQPLCFSKKTLEGERSQDKPTPNQTCSMRGGLGAWTHKETRCEVAHEW
jgi:hypothetical protein